VAACTLLGAPPAAAQSVPGGQAALPSWNTIADLAGNSQFQRLATALERSDLARLPTTAHVHALCVSYARLKRFRRLGDCLDALEARVRRGDTETLLLGLDDATPDLHLMRGAAHVDLGRAAEAIAEAEAALAWVRSHPEDRDQQIEALALATIAHARHGEREAAERRLAELVAVPAGGGVLGRRDVTTIRSIALARAYTALGRPGEALAAIEADRAFSFNAAIDNALSGARARGRNAWRWQELPRLFTVAHSLLRLGRVAEAKLHYDRLLAVPELRDNGEIHWYALVDRGAIAEIEGDADGAIDFYRRAIDVLEEQRSSITHEISKLGFLRDRQEPFERIVRLLFEAGRDSEVFDYIERSKSRALLDMLAGRVTFGEPWLASVRRAGEPAGGRMTVDFRERDRAQIVVSSLRAVRPDGDRIPPGGKTPLPDGVDVESDFSVFTWPAQLLRRSLRPDEAIVQYFLAQDYVAIAVLTAERQVTVRRLADGLADKARELRRLAAAPDTPAAVALAASRRVRAALIAPVEDVIRGKRLIIVPHGPLHYVPFAALARADDARVLLDEHTLQVLPSASLVGLLRTARRGEPGARSLAVFGNPTGDLPGAEAEAKLVASSAAGAQLFLRQAATREAFVRSSADVTRIHIAAHAKFYIDRPLESALLFSPSARDDGRFTVRDLYRLNLDVDLVVLSACDTGMSAVHRGDELVGLIRGFLYAGARSIVATLWEIEDESAARFSTALYAGLRGGDGAVDKAAAVRRAMLAVKAKWPHPLYWAPFVLTGAD
jgi:CHAT domain-containing protein